MTKSKAKGSFLRSPEKIRDIEDIIESQRPSVEKESKSAKKFDEKESRSMGAEGGAESKTKAIDVGGSESGSFTADPNGIGRHRWYSAHYSI
jgi:hypothetical protein